MTSLLHSPHSQESALLQAATRGDAKVYAVFGGQGNTESYFDEIRAVYDTHGQRACQLVKHADGLLQGLCQDERAKRCFTQQPIQFLDWLIDPLQTPDTSLLISAPFSFPLIGVLTLARYAMLCERLGKTPGQLRSSLKGTTGHSQGILVATVVALADSWEDYFAAARDAITVLFWIGVRSREWSNQERLSSAAIATSLENDEGRPTPMLSVQGLNQLTLKKHIDAVNSHLREDRQLSISLINTRYNTVVSGPPQSLCGLNARLRNFNVPQDLDQSRVPSSQRKSAFSRSFLPVSAPFHSKYLKKACEEIIKDVGSVVFAPWSLKLPLYATNSGENLQLCHEADLVPKLVRMITSESVDWPCTINFPQATHVLDFGPGGSSGVGALVSHIKQGTGLRVILVTDVKLRDQQFGNILEVLDSSSTTMSYATAWADLRPRLIQDSAGRVHLDTKFSRLLSLPPIMVAGMTPTTVHWDFVAAIMNAGYHTELAGGGYLHTKEMEAAINNIQEAVPPGRGITCNLIYSSPRAITWQIPLIRSLTAKGVNIDGLTIGAGVPSTDVANEYIRTLGLKHITFKPGSLNAIVQVVIIAKLNPSFPIILQWTGGRGGGHHSSEDFHQPILQTYQSIRQCANICLVAGSGFGGAEDTYPYLTGEWSRKFQLPPMPFDGLLLGSRMMVSKEAHTCTAAKEAIVHATGVSDADWTQTYTGEAGDVISVISEMGQPIHKLSTRGTRLWAEMDRSIFSLDRSKRTAQLQKDRAYIMEKLDKDFQKPWFGKTGLGVLVDLEEMTYNEVLQRLIHLTYVRHVPVPRWAHESWSQLTQDFIHRIEQRFSGRRQASAFDALEAITQPLTIAEKLSEAYPSCATELMKNEDVLYFLTICRRREQKPVPFVPRLDDNFETWFKKDSLWQSEDIDAIVGQDVGRVCILQGPVAVKYSQVMNEPVKDILDNITNQHIEWLTRDEYGGSQERIPTAEYFSNSFSYLGSNEKANVVISKSQDYEVFAIPGTQSDETIGTQKDWFRLLGGGTLSWRQAAFDLEFLVRGKTRRENPIRAVFRPRRGIRVTCTHANNSTNPVMSLQETSRSNPVERARLEFTEAGLIRMKLMELGRDLKPAELTFIFTYHPAAGYSLIREVMTDRTQRIQQFYYHLWFGEDLPPSREALTDVFDGGEVTLNQEMLQNFQSAIGNHIPPQHGSVVPLDLGIVVAWKSLMKPIFQDQIGGDILTLVHLSNSFRILPGAEPLREGDTVNSKSKITMLLNNDTGRLVEVQAVVYQLGTPVLEITSQFQYRGLYTDFAHTFQRKKTEPAMQLYLEDEHTLSVLSSKDWFLRENSELDLMRTVLHFELETYTQFAGPSVWSRLEVSGTVRAITSSGEHVKVGSVLYEANDTHGNPVVDFLKRNAKPIETIFPLPNPVALHKPNALTIVAPGSNSAYSNASGDYNPIHTSETFSGLAGLPGTITHGMYTSATVRNVLEELITANHVERFRSFKCSFLGMVLPSDELQLVFEHTAMVAGRKLISVVVTKKGTGERVLQGQAEIDQPTTSYVFTGQGSQEKGMGMDLYESSPVAKMIWDAADKHLLEVYGRYFSNPDALSRIWSCSPLHLHYST